MASQLDQWGGPYGVALNDTGEHGRIDKGDERVLLVEDVPAQPRVAGEDGLEDGTDGIAGHLDLGTLDVPAQVGGEHDTSHGRSPRRTWA